MYAAREEESFALVERCTSKVVYDELRYQEKEALSCEGAGLLPGLTKAYRASQISHHPIVLS
ncbi:MAG: hypothetical protein H7249_08915 [Chitinophagaceae bacterium]|nr:hypothetical protein [Oligoflexus sp.]